MILILGWSKKKVECFLQFLDEALLQAEEFKYLRLLLASDGKIDWEVDQWIWSAVIMLYLPHHICRGGECTPHNLLLHI